jgi:hypothetical protein
VIFEGLEFIPMKREDVPVLTPVMKRAFDDDSRLFFGKPAGGPPGYDDGSFLVKWGIESGAHAFRLNLDGEPVGAMILFIDEEKRRGFLGCLFIDADRIGKGYGSVAWRFAERQFPQVAVAAGAVAANVIGTDAAGCGGRVEAPAGTAAVAGAAGACAVTDGAEGSATYEAAVAVAWASRIRATSSSS